MEKEWYSIKELIPRGDSRRRWGSHKKSDAEITVLIAISWLMLLIPAFLLPT